MPVWAWRSGSNGPIQTKFRVRHAIAVKHPNTPHPQHQHHVAASTKHPGFGKARVEGTKWEILEKKNLNFLAAAHTTPAYQSAQHLTASASAVLPAVNPPSPSSYSWMAATLAALGLASSNT